jgi:hypothetical protein
VLVTFRRHNSVTTYCAPGRFILQLLHGAEQCTQPLAKAEEKHVASALQHNGKMEDVTKSLLRRAPAFDDVHGRVMLRARNDAGGRPLVFGSLCRHVDRLCHSIRSFSMAVLRRLGAGGSLRKHRTRRLASRARYSHSEWFFGVMTVNVRLRNGCDRNGRPDDQGR